MIFIVTLTDTDNLTDTATLSFNVVELPNRAPVDQLLFLQVLIMHLMSIETVTVDLAGSDLDGDTPLAWSVSPENIGATIDASTGVLTYTATEAQGGSAVEFTVTLTDPGNLTDTETLTFNVVELANRAPVIGTLPNFNNAPNEHETVTVNLTGSDPDGDTQH